MTSILNKSSTSLKQIDEEILSNASKHSSRNKPLPSHISVKPSTAPQKPPEISDQSEMEEMEHDSVEDYIPAHLNSTKASLIQQQNERSASLFMVKGASLKSADNSMLSQKKDPDSIGAFIDEIMKDSNPETPARKKQPGNGSKQPTSVVKSLVFDNLPSPTKKRQQFDPDSIEGGLDKSDSIEGGLDKSDSFADLEKDFNRQAKKNTSSAQSSPQKAPATTTITTAASAVSLLAESLPPPGFRNIEPHDIIDIDIDKDNKAPVATSFRLPNSNKDDLSSLTELLKSEQPAKKSPSKSADKQSTKKDKQKDKKDEISGLGELLRSELQANNPGNFFCLLKKSKPEFIVKKCIKEHNSSLYMLELVFKLFERQKARAADLNGLVSNRNKTKNKSQTRYFNRRKTKTKTK